MRSARKNVGLKRRIEDESDGNESEHLSKNVKRQKKVTRISDLLDDLDDYLEDETSITAESNLNSFHESKLNDNCPDPEPLSVLVHKIKAIFNEHLVLLCYEGIYLEIHRAVLNKQGDKLYSWIVGLTEEHLDEVQKRIVSTLYAGDISSFDVHKIVENMWGDYLSRISFLSDASIYMDRIYCKAEGKTETRIACTDLFRRKIELVFPIQVQERLASALLRPLQFHPSSAVQVVIHGRQDLCSVSLEDFAAIQSIFPSLVCKNSSHVQIINTDILFKDPSSGDTVCMLSFVDFVIKQYVSLFCKGSMIDKIDHNKFVKREPIREGGYGLIYSAEWKERKEKVILKYVKSNPNIRKFIEEVRNFNKEMRIHQILSDHDNIITFYGMAQDLTNQQFAMVLQYADGGSLREYLEYNFENLSWFDKLRFAQEITKGILWIHGKKIIHRDLHSNNILVHQRKIKISDFGLSEVIDHSTRSFVGGIPAYMEPQLFISSEYCLDEKSDVYSLGVLLWEISSGQPPFNSKSPEQVIALITNNKREMPIYGTPIKYASLHQECWQQDPQLRPTTEEVFNVLESIPIDSVIETRPDIIHINHSTYKVKEHGGKLNPSTSNSSTEEHDDSISELEVPADINSPTSNLSIEYKECDDGVKNLDIND